MISILVKIAQSRETLRSGVGTGLEVVNDICEDKFSWRKTIVKGIMEFGPKILERKYGDFNDAEGAIIDNLINGMDRIIPNEAYYPNAGKADDYSGNLKKI